MTHMSHPSSNAKTEGERTQSSFIRRTDTLTHGEPIVEDTNIGSALAGGKLIIEQRIGYGGGGAVYKARHRELMMPVAVKVLHESLQDDFNFCRHFYAEALAVSRLDHPNVTRVIDFGQEPDGKFYFAMEFLDGVDLRTLIESERKLPAARIAAGMMQVCAGLSHAHSRGIVHRDVKPENLVLVPAFDDDGREIEIIKICDFGIAQHRSRPAEEGIIAGTPEYMSPEQCRCAELDARSDIYSCGVIMYELATGQPPFMADHPTKLLNLHQFKKPVPPTILEPHLDRNLEAIILKALAKDPKDRFASMRELRAALRALVTPAEAAKPSTPPPATKEGASTPRHETPEWTVDPDTLSRHASAWTAKIARTAEPKQFAQRAQMLETTVRTLAQYGEIHSLWQIASTMHGIAAEGIAATGSRASTAKKFLRVFDEPEVLARIAERMLVSPADVREKARRVLLQSGVSGAYGLYLARVKLAHVPAVRPLFMKLLEDFGAKAWPVIKAALETIAATSHPNAATIDLAEDLLTCVPSIGDSSSGHVVLKFLGWSHSGVRRAAASAVIKLWGFSAKPVFFAMTKSRDAAICIAGMAGLCQLRAIDEDVVFYLDLVLAGTVMDDDDARATAALALAHASPSARESAALLLGEHLTRCDVPPSSRTREVTSNVIVVTMARALLAMGDESARSLVAQRADQSSEPLRAQLHALLV